MPFKQESGCQDRVFVGIYRVEEREFPFPSNGKAYHKALIVEERNRNYWKFPFPSNGKAYHKGHQRNWHLRGNPKVSIPFKRESVSQVITQQRKHQYSYICVSIPFKRESVSQGSSEELTSSWQSQSFHSLQTGKRITSHYTTAQASILVYLCFNSLQTGKRITSLEPPSGSNQGRTGFNSLQTGKRITRKKNLWFLS